MPLFETACSALPFLSARWVEMGLQPSGPLSDLLDRPTNCFRCPIQVQDQTRPQAVGGFQAVGPLGDHPRLVVDPLHRRTRLMRVEVVQDLRLPAVIRLEERPEVQPQAFGLAAEFPQPACRRDAVAGGIKDLLEPDAVRYNSFSVGIVSNNPSSACCSSGVKPSGSRRKAHICERNTFRSALVSFALYWLFRFKV